MIMGGGRLSLITAIAVMAAVAGAARAEDGAAGHWRVQGKVSGFAFTLNCQFDQSGAKLTGVCVDGATSDPKVKGGRGHPLVGGSAQGERVAFSYQSSFLLSRFQVDYLGVRRGDRMSGSINVQGKTGEFTAERTPS